MEKNSYKDFYKKKGIWFIALMIIFLVLLVLGSFYDYVISSRLYKTREICSSILTILGMYLFFGLFVLYVGCLAKQAIISDISISKKVIYVSLCAYMGLSTSVLGTMGLLEKSCIGTFFDRDFSFFERGLFSIFVMYPLFFLGLIIKQSCYRKKLVKELVILLIFMTISFYLPTIIKILFKRPRFLVTVMGYEGIKFEPWYKISGNHDFFIHKFNLAKDDFYSFPSGHAVNAVINIIAVPVLAKVVPFLEGKEKQLIIISIILAPFIMLSRVVLGAHYLSDISIGAMFGFIMCFTYEIINDRLKNE